MSLSHEDNQVVVNALYTAAEKYRECAKAIQGEVNMNEDARASLVAQFNRQAEDCSRVLEIVEV